MKLLFKQRFFSWLDSYDIYNEAGDTVYTVQSELAWGHCLKIFDTAGNEVGTVKEKVLTWLPKFEMYRGEQYIGSINKEFSLFTSKFHIDYRNWQAEGDWLGWDYTIQDGRGRTIASITKEVWKWTDTYVIDVHDPHDALYALMLVLAIDAEQCSSSN